MTGDDGSGRVFEPRISLGNALIIVTMLASAGGVLLVTGRQIQGLVDEAAQQHADLMHETEMRVQGEKNESEARLNSERAIVGQIANMTNQESRDVQAINQTLQNMREDYRELLRVSGPSKGRN